MFLYHWREESQHAILDELEWVREDGKLGAKERDKAVDDLIGLAGAVDGIVQAQAKADAEDERFNKILGGLINAAQGERIGKALEPILA